MTTQSVDVVEWLNRRAAAFRHMLGDRDSDTEDAMLAAIAEIIALRSERDEAYKRGERVGIERAAKWHDDEVERIIPLKPHGSSPSIWMRAIWHHEECAKALRALSASTEPPTKDKP